MLLLVPAVALLTVAVTEDELVVEVVVGELEVTAEIIA